MKMGSVFILALGASALFLSGCATTGRNVTQENDNLKVQIQNLETQMQKKDAEIESLRKALSATTEEKYAAAKLRTINRPGIFEHPAAKEIQIALKNAGFDPGTPDGKLGKKTRQAIKEFQKVNGLDADGKVGKKTWELLSPYLEKAASN
jgi:peptidoglycan hydrolase-like protein with peptidoglycan-binding domain